MLPDSFNRSLDFNKKSRYFFASWLLIEVVLLDAFGRFLLVLNHMKVIHLEKDFNPSHLVWGEDPFWNIIKILLVSLFAFMFGIGYSYLARKIRENEKAIISQINAVISVFGSVILIIGVLLIFNRTSLHDSLIAVTSVIKNDRSIANYILLQLLGTGIFTYFGLNYGQKLVSKLPEDSKGRLLGIKWYHYLWLWFGIGIYVEALLMLVYFTIHSIRVAAQHFSIGDLLGGTSANGKENNLQSLFTTLIFYYIIAVIILSIIKYEHQLLSGEKKINAALKVLIGIAVGIILPLLLVMFTVLGYSNA